MTNPRISIDRRARKWAVFDGWDIKHPFTPYTDEAAALQAAQDWVATQCDLQAEVVYPMVTKMRMSSL